MIPERSRTSDGIPTRLRTLGSFSTPRKGNTRSSRRNGDGGEIRHTCGALTISHRQVVSWEINLHAHCYLRVLVMARHPDESPTSIIHNGNQGRNQVETFVLGECPLRREGAESAGSVARRRESSQPTRKYLFPHVPSNPLNKVARRGVTLRNPISAQLPLDTE